MLNLLSRSVFDGGKGRKVVFSCGSVADHSSKALTCTAMQWQRQTEWVGCELPFQTLVLTTERVTQYHCQSVPAPNEKVVLALLFWVKAKGIVSKATTPIQTPFVKIGIELRVTKLYLWWHYVTSCVVHSLHTLVCKNTLALVVSNTRRFVCYVSNHVPVYTLCLIKKHPRHF